MYVRINVYRYYNIVFCDKNRKIISAYLWFYIRILKKMVFVNNITSIRVKMYNFKFS